MMVIVIKNNKNNDDNNNNNIFVCLSRPRRDSEAIYMGRLDGFKRAAGLGLAVRGNYRLAT